MSRSFIPGRAILALALLIPGALRAADDEQAAAMAKLRDSLRSTMLQLRNAEGEKAALQATKAELEGQITGLTSDLQKLSKEASAAKIAADKAANELSEKLAAAEEEAARYRESLAKWQTGYAQLADAAKAKEAQRAQLAHEAAVLKRKVEDQRSRNVALYQVGTEILERYEKFSLGDAIKAREPFTGIKRARLESLIDEWEVKLEQQRLKQEKEAAAAAPTKSEKPRQ